MSGRALSDMLLTIAEEHNAPLAPLIVTYSAALTTLRSVDDLEDRMRAAAELLLASEAAEEGFAQAKDAARAALTTAFCESGAPGIYTMHHHVTPTAGARQVIVTDEAALAARHPDLMIVPPPKPDKTAISRLLRTGGRIEGATLSNGTSPGIRITANRKS